MTPRSALANASSPAAIPAVPTCGVVALWMVAVLAGPSAWAGQPEPSATAAVASEPDEPLPPPAAATPTTSRAVARFAGPPVQPPPLALAIRWSPLAVRDAAPNVRKELQPIVVLASKGRVAEACAQATAMLDARMAEASKLFYAPVRKDANVEAIDRFLERWVRGNDPVLVITAEALAPAPSWRDAAASACLRAGRFGDAERLLRPAAFLPEAGRLRALVALLRWMRTRDLRPHAWLLDEAGAGVEARLMRLVLEAPEAREASMAALRQGADGKQRELIDAVDTWLRSAR